MIVSNGLVGLWALGAVSIPALRTRLLWFATAAAEVSVFVQVVLGVALVAGEDRDASQFHMFYGFVALIAVAILYSYRHQLAHRIHLLYGLGGLFVAGLGVRALLIPPG